MLDAHRQTASALRLEWGSAGVAAVGPGCAVAVAVDVLSFTTTVTVAADRGIAVLPHRWDNATPRASSPWRTTPSWPLGGPARGPAR